MPRILFDNAALLDADAERVLPDRSVLVVDDRIVEVGPSTGQRTAEVDRVIDLHGNVLMPGLIDCHVHVTAATADLAQQSEWSPFYLAARAGEIMRGMLE